MLDKSIEEKMIKYNKLRAEADFLQDEIEAYLVDTYNIDESDYYAHYTNPYSIDGVCPIYEWGERYFDIDMIKDIIAFYEAFTEENGENPSISDIIRKFSTKYEK